MDMRNEKRKPGGGKKICGGGDDGGGEALELEGPAIALVNSPFISTMRGTCTAAQKAAARVWTTATTIRERRRQEKGDDEDKMEKVAKPCLALLPLDPISSILTIYRLHYVQTFLDCVYPSFSMSVTCICFLSVLCAIGFLAKLPILYATPLF
jgi:hypothetical protein